MKLVRPTCLQSFSHKILQYFYHGFCLLPPVPRSNWETHSSYLKYHSICHQAMQLGFNYQYSHWVGIWQPTDREYKLFLISQRRFPLYIYTYTNIPTGYRVANSDKSFNFPNTWLARMDVCRGIEKFKSIVCFLYLLVVFSYRVYFPSSFLPRKLPLFTFRGNCFPFRSWVMCSTWVCDQWFYRGTEGPRVHGLFIESSCVL